MTSSATVVVLFYRYFLPTPPSPPLKLEELASSTTISDSSAVLNETTLQFFQIHAASYYLPLLQKYQKDLCQKLGLGNDNNNNNVGKVKGRILLSQEGINGTLSCPSMKELTAYIEEMEGFDLIRDLGVPPLLSDGDDSGVVVNTDNGNNSEAANRISTVVPKAGGGRLFTNIDWKISNVHDTKQSPEQRREPFPDLKIQIVKEVVNTGGTIHVKDLVRNCGKEISADDFHRILMEAQNNNGGGEMVMSSSKDTNCEPSMKKGANEKKQKEVVLIDVRNTFEHSIGHFLHPTQSDTITSENAVENHDTASQTNTNGDNKLQQDKSDASPPNRPQHPTPALNPNTVTFSHFDSTFCSQYSDSLKDKKVLMYCTGGIRCVKASAMLKQRGVEDVSHLSGGIHRYVEKYGSSGFYKGKVFVFDQRVALDPDSMAADNNDDGKKEVPCEKLGGNAESKVVGKCIECHEPHDEISGANLCTVCRDLVLVCPACKNFVNEFYCERHNLWRNVYYTFLERFTLDELQSQCGELQKLHDTRYVAVKKHKNLRRTLRKQIDKVLARIKDLEEGTAVQKNAKRRCRTCFESEEVCDGLCWGFWRSLQSPHQMKKEVGKLEPILAVNVGDRVVPGPNWNTLRHGSRCSLDPESSRKKSRGADVENQLQSTSSNNENTNMGTVVEIKSWASGGNEMDCVAVLWDTNQSLRKRKGQGKRNDSEDDVAIRQSVIYRWGAVARNRKRMYDVKLV